MISQKLKIIFIVSIPIFIMHGLEEYVTKFYTIDKFYLATLGRIGTAGNVFLVYQMIFWLLLLTLLFAISKQKRTIGFLGLVGIIMTLELQHLYEAIIKLDYYPGLWTSLLFIPIAFLFWKEFIKNVKSNLSA